MIRRVGNKKTKYMLSIGMAITLLSTGCSGLAIYSQEENNPATSASNITSNATDGQLGGENYQEMQREAISQYIDNNMTDGNNIENNAEDASQIAQEQEKTESVSLIMVGDILLHTPINEGALQDDGSYDYHHLFAQVADEVKEADLALVNQEVILGGSGLGVSGYPAFNAPFEVADALCDTGFDVVLHGTNHALDKGEKGIISCLNYWKTAYPDMAVLGVHENEEDSQDIYYTEQNGIRIAILNYTYGTNGITVPAGKEYLVDYLEEEQVRQDIKQAEENAEFTIVCPHWGTEYKHGISAEQKKWTQIFLEEGVDLVIGTHPHVIEPIEWIEDESHAMLVYYSLGNFINCTSGSGAGTADRMVGGMAEVTIKRDAATGEVSIEKYSVEPLITQMAFGKNEITTYFLKDYSQSLAEENKVRERDANFSYDFCTSLCDEVFGDIWRTNP